MLIFGCLNSCTIIYHIIHNLAELRHIVFYIVNAGFNFGHLGGVQRNWSDNFRVNLAHLLFGRPESWGHRLQSARAGVALLVIVLVSGLEYWWSNLVFGTLLDDVWKTAWSHRVESPLIRDHLQSRVFCCGSHAPSLILNIFENLKLLPHLFRGIHSGVLLREALRRFEGQVLLLAGIESGSWTGNSNNLGWRLSGELRSVKTAAIAILHEGSGPFDFVKIGAVESCLHHNQRFHLDFFGIRVFHLVDNVIYLFNAQSVKCNLLIEDLLKLFQLSVKLFFEVLAVWGLGHLNTLLWPQNGLPNWHRSFRWLVVWAKVLLQNNCLSILLDDQLILLSNPFLALLLEFTNIAILLEFTLQIIARARRWLFALDGKHHGWLLIGARLVHYALTSLLAIRWFGSLFEHGPLLVFNSLIETFGHLSPRFISFLIFKSYLVLYWRARHFLLKVHLVFNRAILYRFNYLLDLIISANLNGLIVVFWCVNRR